MAEAIAAPLAIAGAQGGWAIAKKICHSHCPKCQLKKWEDRIAEALEKVQKQHLMIKPKDMKELMQQHEMYCIIISQFSSISTRFKHIIPS